jgi:hypothetical protein
MADERKVSGEARRSGALPRGRQPGDRMGPLFAGVVAGSGGGVVALIVGLLLRPLLGVLTLGEVLADWANFFVPFAVFEFMINTFRGQAKVMLLGVLLVLAMLVCAAVGTLDARWPTPRVALLLALALWLITMVVIFPGAEYGFFGSDTRAGPVTVSAAYICAWAAFAAVMSGVYWWLVPSRRVARRAAAGGRIV